MNEEKLYLVLQHPNLQSRKFSSQLRSPQTRAESLLWYRLKGNRVNGMHFRRQQPIFGFIADFYCHRAKLIVEVDGPIHDSHQVRDSERDTILRAHGYYTIRFTNEDVCFRCDTVLAAI